MQQITFKDDITTNIRLLETTKTMLINLNTGKDEGYNKTNIISIYPNIINIKIINRNEFPFTI